ncbi:hypothetical protein BGX29_004107, partial [Mortierella sp. GBA35]
MFKSVLKKVSKKDKSTKDESPFEFVTLKLEGRYFDIAQRRNGNSGMFCASCHTN